MAKWLTGFHAVEESLKASGIQGTLYITGKGDRYDKLIRLAQKRGIPYRNANRQKIQALSGLPEARDCALQIFKDSISIDNKKTEEEFQVDKSATLELFLEKIESEDRERSTVLVLDCITDPQNLGAILRSADQFGADCVIIPQRGSAKNSATVMKTSAGAARYVKIFVVPNLRRAIELLKQYNYWVYGTDMGGTPIKEEKFTPRAAIVMGNEGKGMRSLTSATCDSILSIPMCGHIDSLNVSVACGIILYEMYNAKTE